MIYYTGDCHGRFNRVAKFIVDKKLTKDDVIVILGDASFNYFGDMRDHIAKEYVNLHGVTVLCVHGNHEMRPQTIKTYKTKTWNGDTVYFEKDYPHLLFAPDGAVYNLGGKKTLVIGGAYSVDRFYRLEHGMPWFSDEQPTQETKDFVKNWIRDNKEVDQVLSHTCPFRYEPTEAFLDGIDQSTVDTSTEEFLDEVEKTLKYGRWLCGHWHIDKEIDKIRFVKNDFIV